MKKGFVVCLSVILAGVIGLVGGWLTFPMLFPEEPPSNNNGVVVPTATLANTMEKNNVFTDELLSGVSSVRFSAVGIHKDEAPLYIKRSKDAEALLIALKKLELRFENELLYPTGQTGDGEILYGTSLLSLYSKNGEVFLITLSGDTISFMQDKNGYRTENVYTITSENDLYDIVKQTFQLDS